MIAKITVSLQNKRFPIYNIFSYLLHIIESQDISKEMPISDKGLYTEKHSIQIL